MGVDSEAEVGLARPVLQVVARLRSAAREIGDFILRNSGGGKVLAGALVKLRGEFFIGNKVSVVTCAPCDQVAAQSGVIVDLEHVDADVRDAQIDGGLD